MKTQIFESYSDFLIREDKKINGVSEVFAEYHPNFEQENESNKACWNCYRCSGCSDCYRCSGCSDCYRCSDCSGCSGCSGCSDCSRCSDCSGCSGCYRCSDCSGCSGCYRCSDCSDCSGCSDCSRCYRCSDCSRCYRCSDCSDCYRCSGCSDCYRLELKDEEKDAKGKYAGFKVPVVENIHTKILEAVKTPESLAMGDWHTCDTTHCRAGWAVHIAGPEGYELERKTSTQFAAMMIFKKSSKIEVSPVRFFEDNETAMADIKRCAELEGKS